MGIQSRVIKIGIKTAGQAPENEWAEYKQDHVSKDCALPAT